MMQVFDLKCQLFTLMRVFLVVHQLLRLPDDSELPLNQLPEYDEHHNGVADLDETDDLIEEYTIDYLVDNLLLQPRVDQGTETQDPIDCGFEAAVDFIPI